MPAGEYLADAKRALHDPAPRLPQAAALAGKVTAMMDVSDGLLTSAATIAEQSGVLVQLENAAMPAHPALAALDAEARRQCIYCGGDDYELLFTARAGVDFAAQVDGVPLTRIGRVAEGSGVEVRTADGALVPFARAGYSHDFG